MIAAKSTSTNNCGWRGGSLYGRWVPSSDQNADISKLATRDRPLNWPLGPFVTLDKVVDAATCVSAIWSKQNVHLEFNLIELISFGPLGPFECFTFLIGNSFSSS